MASGCHFGSYVQRSPIGRCATAEAVVFEKFYDFPILLWLGGPPTDIPAFYVGAYLPRKDRVQSMDSQKTSNGVIDAIWKLLASIRLTIVLLLSLAATSIIGTLIPQNSEPAAYVAAFGETLYRFFTVIRTRQCCIPIAHESLCPEPRTLLPRLRPYRACAQ